MVSNTLLLTAEILLDKSQPILLPGTHVLTPTSFQYALHSYSLHLEANVSRRKVVPCFCILDEGEVGGLGATQVSEGKKTVGKRK